MDYKQPNFYHFSEDSLKLVKEASTYSAGATTLLDIGSGCGVLAIECANRITTLKSIHLIEPQKEFLSYIDFNLKHFLEQKVKAETFCLALSDYKTGCKYDMVICNPPYFEKGTGRVSPSKQKQICRTFEIDSSDIYIEKILNLLSSKGKGFILIPDNSKQWTQTLSHYKKHLEKIMEINGAAIYLIS